MCPLIPGEPHLFHGVPVPLIQDAALLDAGYLKKKSAFNRRANKVNILP